MAKRFLSNIRINDAYTFPASDGTNNQVIKTDGSGNLSFGQLAADSASVMYKDTFTGDGSTTGFTLSNALNDEVQSNIYIDGVYQSKSTYSVSGTAITFSTAPLSGHEIEVISTTGINSGPTAIYTDTFTANGSSTAFTLGQTVHSENQTIVFLNGVYQFKDTYTLSGTTLTLDTAPSNGVSIEVMSIGSAYSGGDILYDHDFTSAGLMTSDGSGVYSITANNSANWNTAYGWGDHGLSAQDKTDIGNLSGTNTGDQDLSSYATQTYVGTQISNLVDSSPATLDTLNELAAALGDDPNFATTTANSIGTKMPLAGGTFTGNVLIGNTVTNPASGFGDQTGIGLKYSTTVPELQVSSDSTAMQLGRTTTGGHGQIMALRYASNTIHSFDTNNASIGTNATFAGSITFGDSHFIGDDADNNLLIQSSANENIIINSVDDLFLRTGGTTKLIVKNGGNVGIGTTDPDHKLEVVGGLALRNSNSRLYFGTNNGPDRRALEGDVNGTLLQVGEGYTDIALQGDVGIGTTNPHFNLQITGGNATEETVLKLDKGATSDTGGHTTILGLGTEGGSWAKAGIGFERTGSYDIGNIHFLMYPPGLNTGSVSLSDSVMTIKNNGNVGIGTTSPDEALQIGQGKSMMLGNYFFLGSGDSNYLGAIGFNRDTTNGNIFNSSYGAYQIHNYQGALKLQVYSPAGGTIGEHKFFNNGDVSLINGISFNGDTAATNQLDDYEEGTWTPTISHNNGTGAIPLTVNSATYVKVGKIVHVRAYLTSINPNGNAGGGGVYYAIRSLPFTASVDGAWEVVYANTNMTSYGGYWSGNNLYFMHNGTNGQRSSIHVNGAQFNAFGANASFMFQAVYTTT